MLYRLFLGGELAYEGVPLSFCEEARKRFQGNVCEVGWEEMEEIILSNGIHALEGKGPIQHSIGPLQGWFPKMYVAFRQQEVEEGTLVFYQLYEKNGPIGGESEPRILWKG